jgi:hypothetical protein
MEFFTLNEISNDWRIKDEKESVVKTTPKCNRTAQQRGLTGKKLTVQY